MTKFLSADELEKGLDHIRQSPENNGKLELVVRRPGENEREVLEEGHLTLEEGLVGDNWITKGSSKTTDGSAHPDMQLNLMNSRVIGLIAPDKDRWKLAGDQLYVDLNLSADNLPPGTQLSIGSAIVEVTAIPHNGCKKFAERFGKDAVRFVNTPLGKELHLRGINAKVVKAGIVRPGDVVTKL